MHLIQLFEEEANYYSTLNICVHADRTHYSDRLDQNHVCEQREENYHFRVKNDLLPINRILNISAEI